MRKIKPEQKGLTLKITKAFSVLEIMIVVAIIGILTAIAIPEFVKARKQNQANACIRNLHLIDTAKEVCGLDFKLKNGVGITEASVNSLITGGVAPVCPAGGIYEYRVLGSNPVCNITGHALP